MSFTRLSIFKNNFSRQIIDCMYPICYSAVMQEIYKIVIFETSSKRRPFEKWFDDLDAQAQRTIALRFDRISLGTEDPFWPWV